MSSLIDPFGRALDYLRISVTDRCNFRCLYCMPPEGIPYIPRQGILSFEEIARVAKVFVQMGGKRLRLTGGEPLVRKKIVDLVAMLALLSPKPFLGLTTNGSHLQDLAAPLKEAGLDGINISLDSLSPFRFQYLTRSRDFAKTRAGIDAALGAGLSTKINVVVLKGTTDQEILDFGEFAASTPLEIRFIEFMPLCGTGWHPEWMLPLARVKEVLCRSFNLVLEPRGSDVAEVFRIEGGLGKLGFIASMTEPFCQSCSRLRLTADGKLRPCLFSHIAIDLRPILRCSGDDALLQSALACAVRRKPAGHELTLQNIKGPEMPHIRVLGG